MRSLRALPTPLIALLTTLTSTLAIPSDDEPLHSLQINTITPVTCSRPTQNGDQIKVNYAGRLLSTGAEFDNSYDRGKPFKFRLGVGRVIKGWDQGLLDMCPGEARELTIPPELGYGSHGVGPIPAGATLVFDTELVSIVGVEQEMVSTVSSSTQAVATETEAVFGIATAPAQPTGTGVSDPSEPVESTEPDETTPTFESEDRLPGDKSPQQMAEDGDAECRLLGPFALIVQGALGAMALLALVYKRFRETPKRPWKIWFFDASKQVLGSMLLHVLNLLMSMLGAGDLAAQAVVAAAEQGSVPNPCSFYILNLGIDTTIGVPVLYVLLKFFHAVYARTPLANPPESIKTGNYGSPPRTTWYFKQLLIYFTSLIFMKLFVWFLFAALPWLPWVGDWALRWTEGNEALQIAFAMFIFPLAMNAIQYYIVDSFIMDKSRGGQDGYSQVRSEDGESVERERLQEEGSLSSTDVEEEEVVAGRGKDADEGLREVNPVPLSVPEDSSSGQGSGGRSSPRKFD